MVINDEKIPAPITTIPSYASLSKPPTKSSLTHHIAIDKKYKVATRLDAIYARGVPVLNPHTKWIGGAYTGVVPVSTQV